MRFGPGLILDLQVVSVDLYQEIDRMIRESRKNTLPANGPLLGLRETYSSRWDTTELRTTAGYNIRRLADG